MNTGIRPKRQNKLKTTEPEMSFEPMRHPGHLVRRLHQICVAVFLDAAKDYNLTHVQFATLVAIERFPEIDQTRVGKLVALDRQTISNVMTRLSQKGLIERKQKDKRTNSLQITGAARALIEVMQPRVQSIDDIILGPLSESEKEVFMTLLQKLVAGNNELSRAPHTAAELFQGVADDAGAEDETTAPVIDAPARAPRAAAGKAAPAKLRASRSAKKPV